MISHWNAQGNGVDIALIFNILLWQFKYYMAIKEGSIEMQPIKVSFVNLIL